MTRRGLPALAFLVAVAYWPFWDGGAITPRWMVLSIGVPLLLWGTPIRMTAAHWLGAAFVAYAALSGLWAPQFWPWAREVWYLALLAGVFCLAAEEGDLTDTYMAFAIGVALSGFIALLEVPRWVALPEANHPAALFGNRNYLAEAALAALLCVLPRLRDRRSWIVLVGLGLAILLPESRGALLAAALVGVYGLCSWRPWLGIALAGGTLAAMLWVLTTAPPPESANTFILRAAIWWSTLAHLDWFGHGLGSYYTLYPLWTPHASILVTRPAHPHNEVIYVLAELGLPGILLWLAFFVQTLWRAHGHERLVVAGLLAVGLSAFPLHLPATGFLLALCAGALARARGGVRARGLGRGVALRGGAVRDVAAGAAARPAQDGGAHLPAFG